MSKPEGEIETTQPEQEEEEESTKSNSDIETTTGSESTGTSEETENKEVVLSTQSRGEKRDCNDDDVVVEEGEPDNSPAPKKAKIAQPPAVSSLLTDVDEYTLDAPPSAENMDDDRINTPSLILFGLHPLVKEPPLRKLCEKYGDIKTMGVRSAFASRYGHVEYSSIQQAKDAYRALNGAKLLHKPILVQPTKAETAN